MKQFIGKTVEVLIEKESKKNSEEWSGRNSQNATVVFPKTGNETIGSLVQVKIHDCTTGTLIGKSIN